MKALDSARCPDDTSDKISLVRSRIDSDSNVGGSCHACQLEAVAHFPLSWCKSPLLASCPQARRAAR